MKKSFYLTFFLFFSTILFATHNRGGYLSYRHIAGLTYEVTITTFTNENVIADRCELELIWGDGDSTIVSRINGPSGPCPNATMGELIGDDVKKNIYVGTHTYSSSGLYKPYFQDPNRNAGINNIPNSVSVPLFVNCELIADSLNPDSSPQFLANPSTRAEVGKPFVLNLSTYDTDGDVLSFKLIEPKSSINSSIPGSKVAGTRVDLVNGELTWTPVNPGEYTLAIEVSTCRNNKDMGRVVFDFQLSVGTSASSQAQFINLNGWIQGSNGRYVNTYSPGDSIILPVTYSDVSASGVELKAYGEGFNIPNGAVFVGGSSTQSIRDSITWSIDSTHVRCTPYIFTFRGGSSGLNWKSQRDLTLMIYVRDSTTTDCKNVCSLPMSLVESSSKPAIHLKVWPNPFNDKINIELPPDVDENISFQFQLFDIQGQMVRAIDNIRGTSFTLIREGLPAGTYVYQLSVKNSLNYTGKVFVVD